MLRFLIVWAVAMAVTGCGDSRSQDERAASALLTNADVPGWELNEPQCIDYCDGEVRLGECRVDGFAQMQYGAERFWAQQSVWVLGTEDEALTCARAAHEERLRRSATSMQAVPVCPVVQFASRGSAPGTEGTAWIFLIRDEVATWLTVSSRWDELAPGDVELVVKQVCSRLLAEATAG
jgi:hypothetical protein